MTRPIPHGVGLTLRNPHRRPIARGKAEGRVDFLELTPENYLRRGGRAMDELELVAARHPFTTHGVMLDLGGTEPFDPDYIAELAGFIRRFEVPWHGEHCSFCQVDGVRLHELFPVPMTRAWARHMARRMREAQDRLGTRLVLENTCYYLALGDAELDEPQFLAEILDGSGCGLLLDVNNVYVNAVNHGFDPFDWLESIDLSRVVEIHMGGHEPWRDLLIVDTHGAEIIPDVHALLTWVLERTGPLPVLVERDAHQPTLSVMLDEVDRVRETVRAALARHDARVREHRAT